MNDKLFTIGHSNHSIDFFIDLLKQNSIEFICDVRSYPYSNHSPQYIQQRLRHEIDKVGIRYVYLGNKLGGRSNDPSCYINGKVQYNFLSNDPIFQYGLDRLKNGIRHNRIALMCAESDPTQCHRMILVCRNLRKENINILHILKNGKIETNNESEQRLMKKLEIKADLYKNIDQCVEEAYDKQAQNIAYTMKEKQIKI